jgi:hypothetical protein
VKVLVLIEGECGVKEASKDGSGLKSGMEIE